jgi:hypothetical protein
MGCVGKITGNLVQEIMENAHGNTVSASGRLIQMEEVISNYQRMNALPFNHPNLTNHGEKNNANLKRPGFVMGIQFVQMNPAPP